MRLDIAKIENLMAQVYDTLQSHHDETSNDEARKQFVFHMMDWLDNLERLVNLYELSESSQEDASKIVSSFLYHVIPHLNAAGRLLLDDVPDPFKGDGTAG